jgi:hypothetical protein
LHVPYGQDDVAAEEAAAELQRLRSGEAELTLHLTEKVLLSEGAAYDYARQLVAACYDTVQDFDDLVRDQFELLRTEFNFRGGHLKKLIAYRQAYVVIGALQEANEQRALMSERQQLQRAKTQARLIERSKSGSQNLTLESEPEPEPEPEPECAPQPEQDRSSASALWRKRTAQPAVGLSIAQLAETPLGEWSSQNQAAAISKPAAS